MRLDRFNLNGERNNGKNLEPAIQVFHPNGRTASTHFFSNGKLTDAFSGGWLPAEREFYDTGVQKSFTYANLGLPQDPADDGPAYMSFYPDGTPSVAQHYRNGQLNDTKDGRIASTIYDAAGNITAMARYEKGRLVKQFKAEEVAAYLDQTEKVAYIRKANPLLKIKPGTLAL